MAVPPFLQRHNRRSLSTGLNIGLIQSLEP